MGILLRGGAMNSFILDSNIYGLIIAAKELHQIHLILQNSTPIRIYGFDVIRKELKEAPRQKIAGINIQAALLRVYSSFITKEYQLTKQIEDLSESYYTSYKALGGGYTKQKLWADFLIVSCASLKGVNIVVSEDNATMLNEIALNAYQAVNEKKRLAQPVFISYELFKKNLRTNFTNPVINSPNKLRVLLGFFHIFPQIGHGILKWLIIYKGFATK